MSQNNSNDKAAMLAKIEGINEVEGFDPTPFAVDYTDLETGEVRKRLPVMIQMAWFRMKYPEGRIAITVSPGKDCFVATAKVYPSYKDGAECYLAEATASRGFLPTRFMLERLYKEFGLDPIIKSKPLSSTNRISGQFTKTLMKRS